MSQKSLTTEATDEITCSICIATYKRVELLKNLLSSLFIQVVPDNIFLEIIVVDNDCNQSAKDTVLKFSNNKKISISYYCQPVKNIALTRNMGMNNAKGKYTAFIDDDEIADEFWVLNLIKTVIKFKADAVFGYVIPVFQPNTPDWLKQRRLWCKSMNVTGSPPRFRYTTNCLVKADVVKSNNVHFDPKWGLTGGEDGVFFIELDKFGTKYVTCKEAITYEIIQEERTKLKFIYSRFYQFGNNYGKISMAYENNKFQRTRIIIFFKAVIGIIFYSFQALIFLPKRSNWIYSFAKFSSSLGKFSAVFNLTPEHYKKFDM